jgi:hypothetical protein
MHETRTRTLQVIALFKSGKAATLLLVCTTAWRIIQHDPTQIVIHWALRFHVDPKNSSRFFALLRMTKLNGHIVKCTNVMHSGLVARSLG